MAYTIEQTSRDVVTLRHCGVGADWRQRYLLLADVHFDSPHCNRRLLRSLLTEAQETGAGVFVFGDWFDGMQGRDDKFGPPSLHLGRILSRASCLSNTFGVPWQGL